MAQKGIHKLAYGMYLLTAAENGRDYGCIVNTVVQVSSKPERIAVCVVKSNLTHEVLLRTGQFNLSGLAEDVPYDLIRNFGMRSSRKVDKFANSTGLCRAANGALRLEQFSNMYLSLQITEQVDLGDHTLFIAQVTEDTVLSSNPTCTYDYFLQNIVPKKSS